MLEGVVLNLHGDNEGHEGQRYEGQGTCSIQG